jgi:hypothetical protein
MSPQQSCGTAENRLEDAQRLLGQANAESLEKCAETLREVVELLEAIASHDARDFNPAMLASFRRIQTGARRLKAQIDHGSMLVRGWAQLRHGAGYTADGLPEIDAPQAASICEA